MNGLEAIELMKQDKIIKLGIYFYRFRNGVFEWNTDLGLANGAVWREENGFDLNSNDYEEYIEPKPLIGWERVGENFEYFFTNSSDSVGTYYASNWVIDNRRYDCANYFSTKEKAEEINFKQTLFRKLQRFSDENGGNEIDRNDTVNQNKFVIFYDYDDKEVRVTSYKYMNCFGGVYFISRRVAEKAIELFHDELIKYFTGDFGGEV